jgi:hypothetical protein
MGIYYFVSDAGDVFEMDCTETMRLSETGRLTSYTVQSGAKYSDHYIKDNSKLSYTGILTDLKTGRVTKTTDEFIGGLIKTMDAGTPFTVYWRDTGTESGYFRSDCMIESFTVEQDKDFGYARGLHAYKASIDFAQFRKAQAATLTREAIPPIKDATSPKKTSNATTTKADDTSKTAGDTTTKPAGDYVINIAKDSIEKAK